MGWFDILKDSDYNLIEELYGRYEAKDSKARIEGSDAVKNLLRVVDNFNLNYIIGKVSSEEPLGLSEENIIRREASIGLKSISIFVDAYRIVIDSTNERALGEIRSVLEKYNIRIVGDE
tara:strand:+ start:1378 stop:1734 length:357 start_codon:yes stop_codon:yes gene_type:complete